MHLTLIPQRALPGEPDTALRVAGDVLVIDGLPHDLAPVPEGGEGEWPDSPLVGPGRRVAGTLRARVLVRLGPTAAADQPADPGRWTVAAAQGAVAIAALRREEGAE